MRFLSLIVAAGYLIVTSIGLVFKNSGPVSKGVVGVLMVAGFLVMPLACIWFGDEIGEYTGMLPGPGINKTTPGSFVRFGGWLLLLLPLFWFWLARP